MKGRILLLEDESSILENYAYFLREAGAEVTAVRSLAVALTALGKGGFDCVVADILLADGSGLELLAAVKRISPNTPVIMITGQPRVESAAEAVRLGAFDYVPKPLRRESLVRVVGMALGHKALKDEGDRLRQEKEGFRRHLEAIFRSVQDGILTVDRELAVIQANQALRRICGLGESLPAGRRFGQGQACRQACRKALEECLASAAPVWEYRIECGLESRPAQVAVVTCSPLLSSEGAFIGGVMVVRDISRLTALERELRQRHGFQNMIGKSRGMQQVFSLVENLAETEATVLITGESGTGKELVVEALHYNGPRADKPLVKVNCSALSENLLESELFGHVRGAFTGAIRDKVGRFQLADGGTIFLDEIGDISPAIQLKLLRVLQEREFERVGDSRTMRCDVRIVAATNRELRSLMAARVFREDLYYRLKVVEVHLPPVRERLEDIPLLVQHFLARFNAAYGKRIEAVGEAVMPRLVSYGWPGNVRELRHAMEHAVILCQGQAIGLEHLPAELHAPAEPESAGLSLRPPGRLEREELIEALRSCGGKKAPAARLLGISRPTLYRKLREHGLEDEA